MSVEATRVDDPEPRQLNGYDQPTRGRRPETYYRCGYQVEGAPPMMVDEFVRIGEHAEKRAREAAADVRHRLRGIGAPAEVFWWTQKWTTVTTDTYDKAFVELIS